MPLTKPYQITVPFAQNGLKNTIPVASQAAILAGAASFTDGFPPLTMQPIAAGGVPPYGQDMNGVLFAVTEALRWMQAGALYPYDSAFANAVGGYPLGAIVSRPDGSGFWRNITDNNKTDPATFGAGWETELSGITSISLSNANVTLTALQASKQIIVLTGALSANINIIFPTQYKQTYTVINKCTGNFSVTCKTLNGTGIAIQKINLIICDGIDIIAAVEQADSISAGYSSWCDDRAAIHVGFLPKDGQLLARAQYPDLWAYAQKTGIISDADWLADPLKRGKYSTGDGTTTFRLPDLNGRQSGSKSVFLRGDGVNSASSCGLIQDSTNKAHTHGRGTMNITGELIKWGPYQEALLLQGASLTGAFSAKTGYSYTVRSATTGDAANIGRILDFDASRAWTGATSSDGEAEARPYSVTGCWIVKAFGAVSNASFLDASEIARSVDIAREQSDARAITIEKSLSDTDKRLSKKIATSDGSIKNAIARIDVHDADIANVGTRAGAALFMLTGQPVASLEEPKNATPEQLCEWTKQRIRIERYPLLQKADSDFFKALESQSDTTAIVARKNQLRDYPTAADDVLKAVNDGKLTPDHFKLIQVI